MISPNDSEAFSADEPVALFSLGRVVATPGALAAIPQSEIHSALTRHVTGDWGDLDPDDWNENLRSLDAGYRLFSVYFTNDGTKFYVITEWDRSLTTVLLPSEY
jgi:hypothetical protein